MLGSLSFTEFLGLGWLFGLGGFVFGVFFPHCFFYTTIFKHPDFGTAKGYIILLKLAVGFLSF